MSISERLKEKLSAIFRRKPSGKGPPLPKGSIAPTASTRIASI